ncbi:MAG: hypothetical protein ABSA02_26960 [Trebonia sp.]|jgi:hypothetical protein
MSQEASAEVAHGGTGTVPSRSVPSRSGSSRSAAIVTSWLRSDLFLRTADGPVGWRKILLAVVCVIGGAAVSLSRTVGPGSLNTIWIEDAKNLLSNGLNSPFWQDVRTPISGYYQVPARVITEIAVQFPLSWAPGIMSAAAALQYAVYGLVAYIASAPYLRSRWLRLLIAAPVCVIPLAYTQANNDLVTVQFIGLYAAFWTVLWIPGTRAGRILSPIVMLSVSSTAALAIVLAPLVVARLVVDRSRNAIFLAVFWFAGVLLQASLTLEGKSKHYLFGFNGPLFVLKYYAARVVPRALFGESALGGPGANYRGDYVPLHVINTAAHFALIGSAWAVVLVAVVLAAARFTDPNWTLAAVAGLFSLAVFADAMLINTPVVQPRYVIAPALLLYAALVALLRPRRREGASRARVAFGWLPVAGLAVLLAVAVTLNFRVTNGRTSSPPWTSVVARATTACAHPGVTSYVYSHEWWQVTIPCSRVR